MRTIKQGARTSDVNTLQATLTELGYDPGPIDGIFGLKTTQAVKGFQSNSGLPADGIVGPITWQALLNRKNQGRQTLKHSVAGWIPAWQQALSFQAVQQHYDLFDTISPFWYTVTASGGLSKLGGAEDNTLLSFAREHGINVIPLINNDFDSELSSVVLNNPELRHSHITNIINLVIQMNYAGIDIDYENLYVKDKQIFVLFLQELKTALAAVNRKLIVTVHAKTDAFGIWSGAEAHDYSGIGLAADNVRIMAYDYHWQGDPPGPIVPIDWVERVLVYATSTISRNKVTLGVPTYGYDWPSGQHATLISYSYAINTAQKYNVTIITDSNLGPHYTYVVNNTTHEVWFTDVSQFSRLLDLVNKYSIAGICMWYPGLEDPRIYDAIGTRFK